jgi:hypothetical protein
MQKSGDPGFSTVHRLRGRHFSRAGETVARSSDTARTRCSGDPGFSVCAALTSVQRFNGNATHHARLRPCNRYTTGRANWAQRARRGACPCGGRGRHFSRAGETVARSSDIARTHCSGDPGFSVSAADIFTSVQRCNWWIAQRCSPVLTCNRHTLEPAAAPPAPDANRRTVTNRPLICILAKRVSLQTRASFEQPRASTRSWAKYVGGWLLP